ncbi:TetR/AcrR family transcriptional regulator [Paenibacillus gansuensis]|uniref:TetR/AcrR family transcriptional regulator n=1 Tax=Paenibacillus gansuensis TaxID=306542 RepID=A0ABW5PGZ3_9BACL
MNHPPKRSPGRPRKTETDNQQTESNILREASAAFMQHGYEKVSLVQIAQQCKVTKATLYYYFDNKATLFTQSVVRMFHNVVGHVGRHLNMDIPLKERLLAMAKVQMGNRFGEFETLMKEASSHLTQEQIQEIRAAEKAIHTLMTNTFQGEMDRGTLKSEQHPMVLSLAFASLVMMGSREMLLELYHGDLNKAAEAVVELFWTGAAAA